jgi:uncharacterized protein YkwD
MAAPTSCAAGRALADGRSDKLRGRRCPDGTGSRTVGRIDRRRTVLINLLDRLRWRPAGPVGWAALAAGILAALGISFLVVGPLAAEPTRTDSLPVTRASPGPRASGQPAPADPSSAVPAPSASVKASVLEDQLVQLINAARSGSGCDKLHNDGHLHNAARGHSEDMAKRGFVGHDGSDGSSPGDRMRKAGYKRPKGEDVGSGYPTAQAAFDAWSADPGQRGPLGDCDLKAVGVGVAAGSGGTLYWTADFGG